MAHPSSPSLLFFQSAKSAGFLRRIRRRSKERGSGHDDQEQDKNHGGNEKEDEDARTTGYRRWDTEKKGRLVLLLLNKSILLRIATVIADVVLGVRMGVELVPPLSTERLRVEVDRAVGRVGKALLLIGQVEY